MRRDTPLTPLKGGIALVLALLGVVLAQGSRSESARVMREFEQARAPRVWKFPRDHGKHEAFQTEWWYYTGNLRDEKGRRYGYQLTFFRNALAVASPARASQWAFRDAYVAHFTLTDVERQSFFYDQRMARGALELAGAANDSLAVRVGAWSARAENDTLRLRAQSELGGIALALRPRRELVLHGERGLVRKGEKEGEASYYYSWPFLQTRGQLRVGADAINVEGVSWMDHEFFSSPAESEVAGWDWFSIHLSDSCAIMLYQLRHAKGSLSKFSSGTLMSPRKSMTISFEAKPREWWQSGKTGARYPIEWDLKVADYALRVNVALREQELDTRMSTGVIYWEGYIAVSGTKGTQPITGMGYLEMTGYAAPVALNAGR